MRRYVAFAFSGYLNFGSRLNYIGRKSHELATAMVNTCDGMNLLLFFRTAARLQCFVRRKDFTSDQQQLHCNDARRQTFAWPLSPTRTKMG